MERPAPWRMRHGRGRTSAACRASQECSGSLGMFWLRIKQKSSHIVSWFRRRAKFAFLRQRKLGLRVEWESCLLEWLVYVSKGFEADLGISVLGKLCSPGTVCRPFDDCLLSPRQRFVSVNWLSRVILQRSNWTTKYLHFSVLKDKVNSAPLRHQKPPSSKNVKFMNLPNPGNLIFDSDSEAVAIISNYLSKRWRMWRNISFF